MNDNSKGRDLFTKEDQDRVTLFHVFQMICGAGLLFSGIGGAIVNAIYPDDLDIIGNVWLAIGVSLIAFLLSCLPVWYYEWRKRRQR